MPKKQYNLMLPQEVIDELELVAAPLGPKRKWMAISAAVVHFLRATPAEQDAVIREVASADVPGGVTYQEIIRRDSSGRIIERDFIATDLARPTIDTGRQAGGDTKTATRPQTTKRIADPAPAESPDEIADVVTDEGVYRGRKKKG